MNDKNKKIIYIAVIVACIGATVYVMFFLNSGGVDNADLDAINTPVNTAPRTTTTPTAVDVSRIEYGAPSVFPAQNKFSTTALDSSIIKSLTPYERLNVLPEEKTKDDPFAAY